MTIGNKTFKSKNSTFHVKLNVSANQVTVIDSEENFSTRILRSKSKIVDISIDSFFIFDTHKYRWLRLSPNQSVQTRNLQREF